MPILDVKIIGSIPHCTRAELARSLAEGAGRALDARPGGTWVRVIYLSEDDYAESDGGPSDGIRPVFVSILEREAPAGDALARRIQALTRAVATACGRPEANVHVLYEPSARGRLAFGGRLVE